MAAANAAYRGSLILPSIHLTAAVHRGPLPLPTQQAKASAAVADDVHSCCSIYNELDNDYGSAIFSTSSVRLSSSGIVDPTEDDTNYDGPTYRVTIGVVVRQRLRRTEHFAR